MDDAAAARARVIVAETSARLGYLPTLDVGEVAPAPASPRMDFATKPSISIDFVDTYVDEGLDPQRLLWILREADLGFPRSLCDLYEKKVMADGHTRGLYERRLDKVCVPSTWKPGDKRPASVQAAEELTEACAAINLDDAIQHAALGSPYGFSYGEIAWWTRADGMQVPAEIACVPHRRFMFDRWTWEPRLTHERNMYPGDPLERRAGSSWIRAETRRWRKQVFAGYLRTVMWWLLFKQMSVRDWIIFAQKFGIPLVLGKNAPNATENQRKALRDALIALGTEGWAILGADDTVEVLNTALRGGAHGDGLHPGIVKLANEEISKVITSATLTADTGGPGSFALGKVHEAGEHALVLADARRLGTVFQRSIGSEFLLRNGLSDKAAPPRLHLQIAKPSLLVDARVLEKLQAMGVRLSAREVHEHFGWGEPSGDDDELKPIKEITDNGKDPADPRDPADSGPA